MRLSAREDDDFGGLERHPRGAAERPLTDETMSVVSWLHDGAATVDVEYGTEAATVRLEA